MGLTTEHLNTVLNTKCPTFTVAQKIGMAIAALVFITSIVLFIMGAQSPENFMYTGFAISTLIVSIMIALASVLLNLCNLRQKVYRNAINMIPDSETRTTANTDIGRLNPDQLSRIQTFIDNQWRSVVRSR